MTRRGTPLLTAIPVVCALTLCPCPANAQTDTAPQVGASETSAQNQLPAPKLKQLKGSESQSSSTFTPTVGQLFSKTLGDFRRLPSLDSAVILGMGGVAASIGHPSDARISHGFLGSDSKSFFSAGETIGASTVQLGAAFATYSLGRATGHPKVTEIGADLVSAQIVSQTLTQAIKFSVARTRPDGTAYSFPSGHSATAFATAAVLQRHLGWKAGIPAYAVATYVASSRIEVQRHYLSDVAFGAAIGIMSGRTVTLGRGNARFALSPAAAPGGAGVNFTWIGKQ
jgi:acid phosphatase family membrane protein YuiD